MIDVLVNGYLDTAQFHLKAGEELDYPTILKELEKESTVSIYGKTNEAAGDQSRILNYVNNTAYSLAAMLTLGIGFIMFVLSNKDIRKRVSCSPIKMTSYSLRFSSEIQCWQHYLMQCIAVIFILGAVRLLLSSGSYVYKLFMFT
jgi:hypothetical protein